MESIVESPLPGQPELVALPEGVAFLFPDQARSISKNLQAELLQAFIGFAFGAPVALGIACFLVIRPGLFPPDLAAHRGIIGLGLVALVVLAGTSLYWRWRRLPHNLQRRLDSILRSIEVRDESLQRIYASGRIESWQRDEIDTVAAEVVMDGDGEGTWDCHRLMLRRRHDPPVHLFGDFRTDSDPRQRQMLEWMALNLRHALQVPYDHPTKPLAGAAKTILTKGIEISVPYERPEDIWRKNVLDFVWLTLCIVGWLLFAMVVVQFHQRAAGQPNEKMWSDTRHIGLGALMVIATFGTMGLVTYLNRRSEITRVADAAVAAVGVRDEIIFRRFASNREETWPVAGTARFTAEMRNKELGERLWLIRDAGDAIALFGDPIAAADSRRREGLQWMARELNAALAQAKGDAPGIEDASEAIYDPESESLPHNVSSDAIRRLS